MVQCNVAAVIVVAAQNFANKDAFPFVQVSGVRVFDPAGAAEESFAALLDSNALRNKRTMVIVRPDGKCKPVGP